MTTQTSFKRSPGAPGTPEAAVRTLRLLVFSLITGLVLYLAVVHFMLRPAPSARMMLAMVAGGLWVVSCAMAWSVPAATRARARREHAMSPLDESSMVTAWMSSSLPRFAMLEGPGLMGVIAYQLDGQWLALVPTGLSVVVMLLNWPRIEQFRRFHEEVTGIRNY